MGLVLRVFQSRQRSLLLTHLKSLVIPQIEYCSQLWNPWITKDKPAIEAIQWAFTYKITEVYRLNYWERLHEIKLYSLQRRRERYIIIYIWKITQHMVSCNGTQNKNKKTPKTWNTVCYSVPDKQKHSTIPSRKSNNCIWASVVQLVAKITERHRKCENWKILTWSRQISREHSW